jgi:hypothetical protein
MVVIKRAIAELPADRLAELEPLALWRCADGRLAFDKRDPRYRAIVDARPTRREPKRPARDPRCVHRGGPVGEGPCMSCAGRVVVKVFACTVHGTCSIDKAPEGVRTCEGCADHSPPSAKAGDVVGGTGRVAGN